MPHFGRFTGAADDPRFAGFDPSLQESILLTAAGEQDPSAAQAVLDRIFAGEGSEFTRDPQSRLALQQFVRGQATQRAQFGAQQRLAGLEGPAVEATGQAFLEEQALGARGAVLAAGRRGSGGGGGARVAGEVRKAQPTGPRPAPVRAPPAPEIPPLAPTGGRQIGGRGAVRTLDVPPDIAGLQAAIQAQRDREQELRQRGGAISRLGFGAPGTIGGLGVQGGPGVFGGAAPGQLFPVGGGGRLDTPEQAFQLELQARQQPSRTKTPIQLAEEVIQAWSAGQAADARLEALQPQNDAVLTGLSERFAQLQQRTPQQGVDEVGNLLPPTAEQITTFAQGLVDARRRVVARQRQLAQQQARFAAIKRLRQQRTTQAVSTFQDKQKAVQKMHRIRAPGPGARAAGLLKSRQQRNARAVAEFVGMEAAGGVEGWQRILVSLSARAVDELASDIRNGNVSDPDAREAITGR